MLTYMHELFTLRPMTCKLDFLLQDTRRGINTHLKKGMERCTRPSLDPSFLLVKSGIQSGGTEAVSTA